MTTATTTLEQTRDAWDAIAPRFDRFTTPANLAFGERLLRSVDLRPGVRFLDVGCGSGALAIPAARQGADVVAIDLAATMIRRLCGRADAERLSTVDGRVMNGESLDLPDGTFDVVASLNGVSVFADRAAGLREMARVTRPGGTVLIAAFGSPRRAEFLSLLTSALQVCVPGLAPLPGDPPPPAFQLAEAGQFHRELVNAGLSAVRMDAVTWETRFTSARRFWDAATASSPSAAQLINDLTEQQRSDVQHVLDGIFRERSGGRPAAVVRTEMNIGIGEKP